MTDADAKQSTRTTFQALVFLALSLLLFDASGFGEPGIWAAIGGIVLGVAGMALIALVVYRDLKRPEVSHDWE